MKSKRLAQLAGLLAVLVLLSSVTHAKTYQMKIAHLGPANYENDDHVPAAFLKNAIETFSNGQIKVQVFPAGQLGNNQETMEAVQLGAVEMTLTSVGGITPFMPELAVIDIPYMFDNDAVVEKFAKGPFLKQMQTAVLKKTKNIRLLAITNSGRWRSMFTTKKRLKTASDLQGVKMRTINSPLQIEFINFLGGNATPVAWTELYTALGAGVVEGTKNSFSDILNNRLSDHVKHAFLDNHAYLFGFIWVSDSWLKSLPPHLQELVVQLSIQAADLQLTINKYLEIPSGIKWKKNGGSVYVPTPAEKASFMQAKEAIAKWYQSKYGAVWYKRLIEAVKQAETEVRADTNKLLQ